MLIQIHENQKLIEKYWGGCGQKSCSYSSHRTVKQALSKEGSNGLIIFLHVDIDSGKLKVTLIILD